MFTLEAVPLRALGWDFRIESGGRTLATLELTRFRDRATFTWGGSEYHIEATGFLQRSVRLARGGVTVARAEKRGWIRGHWAVVAGDRELVLRRKGFLGQTVTVEHNRTRLGEIRKPSLFRRTVTASLDERLQGPIPAFLLFLAIVEWRRDSRRHS